MLCRFLMNSIPLLLLQFRTCHVSRSVCQVYIICGFVWFVVVAIEWDTKWSSMGWIVESLRRGRERVEVERYVLDIVIYTAQNTKHVSCRIHRHVPYIEFNVSILMWKWCFSWWLRYWNEMLRRRYRRLSVGKIVFASNCNYNWQMYLLCGWYHDVW